MSFQASLRRLVFILGALGGGCAGEVASDSSELWPASDFQALCPGGVCPRSCQVEDADELRTALEDTSCIDIVVHGTIQGSFDIARSVVLRGSDPATSVLDGDFRGRVLDATALSRHDQLTVRDITIQRGNADGEHGGGLHTHGSQVRLESVTMKFNLAAHGGAFSDTSTFDGSNITIVDSTFHDNWAFDQSGAFASGSAVHIFAAHLEVRGTLFTMNQGRGSISVRDRRGVAEVFDSQFERNEDGLATGIYFAGHRLLVQDSSFRQNFANAVVIQGGNTDIVRSNFDDNRTALQYQDSVERVGDNEHHIVESRFAANSTGIRRVAEGIGGSVRIQRSSIVNNEGIGLHWQSATLLEVDSSTIAGNNTGLHAHGTTVVIEHSTFAANQLAVASPRSQVWTRASIFTAEHEVYESIRPARVCVGSGKLLPFGPNLITEGDCLSHRRGQIVSPALGLLPMNDEARLPYFPLGYDSAAHDRGGNRCRGLDQLGQRRGSPCDLGAVEAD